MPSPLRGRKLYVAPNGHAARQAVTWATSRPADAALMRALARYPVGLWLTDHDHETVASVVDSAIVAAGTALRVFVAYRIPNRDGGGHSAGGAADSAAYARWVDDVAEGLDGRLAIVVLEPDALAMDAWRSHTAELASATKVLTAAGARVYLDIGNSNWVPSADSAERLTLAGVDEGAGFATNTSHYELLKNEHAYAAKIRAILGPQAHYVVDTGRCGVGTAGSEWGNAPGQGCGPRPRTDPWKDGCDALVWAKPPGESDAEINGGPKAGAWWPESALDLARRAVPPLKV